MIRNSERMTSSFRSKGPSEKLSSTISESDSRCTVLLRCLPELRAGNLASITMRCSRNWDSPSDEIAGLRASGAAPQATHSCVLAHALGKPVWSRGESS